MPDATPAPPAQGLELRDYFAGQAIVGLIQGALSGQHGATMTLAANWQTVAARAYEIADHLLRARAGSAGSAPGTGRRPT